MIVIIDYRMGNIGSILNMLKKIGAPAVISADPAAVVGAEKLILPGVGADEVRSVIIKWTMPKTPTDRAGRDHENHRRD